MQQNATYVFTLFFGPKVLKTSMTAGPSAVTHFISRTFHLENRSLSNPHRVEELKNVAFNAKEETALLNKNNQVNPFGCC